ncbi:MAG: VTT domain-containing protein [Candidatus Zhuqueibacterota bacterium]
MKKKYVYFILILVLSAIGSLLIWKYRPDMRGIVWLYLYSIPSHVYISFLPHEPVLLYYGKEFNIFAAVAAASLGTLIAGFIDYETLTPLFRHRKVKKLYDDKRLYTKSVDFFYKSPFAMIVIAGFTPIPFYPFKFLSIATGYPLSRYLLALFAGRCPRYFILIWLGYTFNVPNWLLIVAFIAMLLWGVWGYWREKLKKVPDERKNL